MSIKTDVYGFFLSPHKRFMLTASNAPTLCEHSALNKKSEWNRFICTALTFYSCKYSLNFFNCKSRSIEILLFTWHLIKRQLKLASAACRFRLWLNYLLHSSPLIHSFTHPHIHWWPWVINHWSNNQESGSGTGGAVDRAGISGRHAEAQWPFRYSHTCKLPLDEELRKGWKQISAACSWWRRR